LKDFQPAFRLLPDTQIFLQV